MPATLFWVVTKDGKKVTFKTRSDAEKWCSTKDGIYHIYDNDPNGYYEPQSRTVYWR